MDISKNKSCGTRATQQTVSVNICSGDLLSPTIFGLKCHEKLEYFFSSNFRDMEKVMPVIFGEIKMSFWVRKKDQLAFSERQQQLVNSGNISFPRIF